MIKIKVKLDAGINVYSKAEFIEEVRADEWDNMTESDKEEFIRDIALQNINYDYEIIEE